MGKLGSTNSGKSLLNPILPNHLREPLHRERKRAELEGRGRRADDAGDRYDLRENWRSGSKNTLVWARPTPKG